MCVNQVFDPYYFDSFKVTSKSYKEILTNYLLPILLSLPPDAIFLQECAPLFYNSEVVQLLNEKVPDSGIGKEALSVGQLVPQILFL